jgi:hypothetical protein
LLGLPVVLHNACPWLPSLGWIRRPCKPAPRMGCRTAPAHTIMRGDGSSCSGQLGRPTAACAWPDRPHREGRFAPEIPCLWCAQFASLVASPERTLTPNYLLTRVRQ